MAAAFFFLCFFFFFAWTDRGAPATAWADAAVVDAEASAPAVSASAPMSAAARSRRSLTTSIPPERGPALVMGTTGAGRGWIARGGDLARNLGRNRTVSPER